MLRFLFPFVFILLLCPQSNYSQDSQFQSLILPAELVADANAIVRSETVEVEVRSVDKMLIRTEWVITVLNKYGQNSAWIGDVYDDLRKIKNQEVVIYDKLGKKIKRVKKRNFLDRSLVGSNLFTDNRISYYDFTPQDYPYTVHYTSEVESNSTIFVQPWKPVSNYYLSVESSSYRLINKAGIPLRFKEQNFGSLQIQRENIEQGLSYQLTNHPAYRSEILSPDLDEIAPQVKIALNEFSLVGVEGKAADWKEFGKWQYENLLRGKSALPQKTIDEVTALTATAETKVEKIRRIYNYVQENTRYISVQLGIGGWEPMTALEVDELGYGDCKALTNYTRALLESQDITSYYAVVYGGEDREDLDSEFASMQGNHVILNIPNEGENLWLECTSQTTPFNFLGNFTDNRNVLLVRPEGGEIVKTTAYEVSENLQESNAIISLDSSGGFSAEFTRQSSGVPYGEIYHLSRESEKNKDLFYKHSWGHLRNLKLQQIEFHNDREAITFKENLNLSGEKYASKAGNRFLLPLHFLELPTYDLPNNANRNFPIEVERGYTFRETFEFLLPEGFETESIPEGIELENSFGSYRCTIEVAGEGVVKSIIVKREYIINNGSWPSTAYQEYREFMNQIDALGKQKAVIVKII